MPERENVITHLQIIHTWVEFARERDLQFFTPKHLKDIAEWTDDAISMLNEKDTVKPRKVKGYNPPMYTLFEYECEKCKSVIMNKQPFCMGCGRSVKWND